MRTEPFDPMSVRPPLPDARNRADPLGRKAILMGTMLTQRSPVTTTSRKTDDRPLYQPKPAVGIPGNMAGSVRWAISDRGAQDTRQRKNL